MGESDIKSNNIHFVLRFLSSVEKTFSLSDIKKEEILSGGDFYVRDSFIQKVTVLYLCSLLRDYEANCKKKTS